MSFVNFTHDFDAPVKNQSAKEEKLSDSVKIRPSMVWKSLHVNDGGQHD